MIVKQVRRNHIARNAWKVNKVAIFKAKKGKGSYVRCKRVDVTNH